MKVALVHDYIYEFGGAERVLKALTEIFPDAPIYTSFVNKNHTAYPHFKSSKIVTSWVHKYIPFFKTGKLHSPLRFLAPLIWNSFDFSDYDLVISSASWYVTKGFRKKGADTIEICYCHTPPRWLYGYPTSVELQKYWIVRVYAHIVGHFMRMYDFEAAQRVNHFIANSENVKKRIWKFYRRDAKVIYPPVDLYRLGQVNKKDYYLVLSRIVGGKGIDLAVKAAEETGIKLKIAGKAAGYSQEYKRLQKIAKANVEFLGYVSDKQLVKLYSEAKAFLALATDEDFGITPVEAMQAGTPVIAFRGGGYLESVVEGKTGVFFDKPTSKSLGEAIRKFEKMKFGAVDCIKQGQKFGKKRFVREIKDYVEAVTEVK